MTYARNNQNIFIIFQPVTKNSYEYGYNGAGITVINKQTLLSIWCMNEYITHALLKIFNIYYLAMWFFFVLCTLFLFICLILKIFYYEKLVLFIGAFAIVSLTLFNLNLTLNKEGKVNVGFSNVISFAQNENSGNNKCDTYMDDYISGCTAIFIYECISGNQLVCVTGATVYIDCKQDYDSRVFGRFFLFWQAFNFLLNIYVMRWILA